MTMTNGHSRSGAHQRLFELATKAGIRPTWSAIAVKAGLSPSTVRQAFGEPGKSVNSRTIDGLASVLRISPLEVRRIHAALQLEAPTPEPPQVRKTDPAPPPEPEPDPTPRNLLEVLTRHAMAGDVVIVVGKDPSRDEMSLARGVITGIHAGWVAIMPAGDSRAARMKIEWVTGVRKAPAA